MMIIDKHTIWSPIKVFTAVAIVVVTAVVSIRAVAVSIVAVEGFLKWISN